MSIRTFIKSLSATNTRRQPNRQVQRLWLEPLEDRSLPSFGPLAAVSTGRFPGAPAAADFNGDGRLDLATPTFDGLAVSLGNGDGTFQAPLYSPAAGWVMLAAGDLNGDAKTDLVAVTNTSITLDLRVLLGNGDGTFQPPQVIVLPSQLPPGSSGLYPVQTPTSVAVADLDADGTLDLIAGGYDVEAIGFNEEIGYEEYRYDGYVNVRLGNGDGTFGPNTAYFFGNAFDAAVLGAGDFDGDGTADVLAGGGRRLSVFAGNGDGTLQASPRISEVGFIGLRSANPADFDRDGRLDVLLLWTNTPVVMRGNGDGTFSPTAALPFAAPVGAVAVGDVDADGNLDVVRTVNNIRHEYADDPFTTRSAQVLLGDGRGSFAPPAISAFGTFRGEAYARSALLADFNGDGFPELAVSESRYINGFPYGVVEVSINDGNWAPPPPSVSISDVTVVEGNSGTRPATFTVTLSAVSAQPVTVNYATSNGTAAAGNDYHATTGTLTFAPGETSKTIWVMVSGDRLGEAHETFVVNLSSPTNAAIADGQGVSTIVDDEPRVSISDVTKAEGRKGNTTLFTFTVTLSAVSDQPVTMSFRTVNGTAKSSNGDYVARAGTLTFAPGETTKTITIEVKGDSKREANEYFYLDLFGNSSNSLFLKIRGIGTILNDD